VDRCTSQCYDAALKHQLYLPLLEQLRPHFEISVSCGTADRDSANVKLQRHWATRFIQRHHLFLGCQIHNLSTCCGNSLQVLDGDVPGCLSLGLSMQHAGAVVLCRKALQSAVEKHLDLFPNAPAPRHNDPGVSHKLGLFDPLLPDSAAGCAHRKSILSHYLNGGIFPRLQHFGGCSRF